jgi:hypothetical protein
MAAQQLLRLHRQEIAIEHGRRLDERLGQRHRRQLDRKAAGLQHAALDVLARARRCAWQALISLQVLMMPITGRPAQSSAS